jgi:hypothetical protein
VFLPKPIQHGGSLVGNSYLSLFAKCPRKWFYGFYFPQELAGETWHGLAPKHTAEALLLGSAFHEGLAAWYLSGCKDGEDTGKYSLDSAISTAESHHLKRKAEYADQDRAEKDWATCKTMLVQYHESHGPGGPSQDWPEIKVLFDEDGQPLVEREFAIKLGTGKYVYTARLDLIVERFGNVQVMEHKSSAASGTRQRLASSHMDSQMTGEIFVANKAFPSHNLNGVLVNVITKNLSAKSTVGLVNRTTTDRTRGQLQRFEQKVLGILCRIDESIHTWKEYVSKGIEPVKATDMLFPDYGENNGECFSYMRECEFSPFCKQLQPEDITLNSFRPKTQEETITLKEYGG